MPRTQAQTDRTLDNLVMWAEQMTAWYYAKEKPAWPWLKEHGSELEKHGKRLTKLEQAHGNRHPFTIVEPPQPPKYPPRTWPRRRP